MKLAEALLERKNLMTRIKDLHARFKNAAIHEEGDKPEEDAQSVLGMIEADFARYRELVVAINRTNNMVSVSGGTMMEAIAMRDVMKWKHEHFKGMAETVRTRNDGMYGFRAEKAVKKVITAGVEIGDLNKTADAAAQELRKIDAEIQAANWANDLQ